MAGSGNAGTGIGLIVILGIGGYLGYLWFQGPETQEEKERKARPLVSQEEATRDSSILLDYSTAGQQKRTGDLVKARARGLTKQQQQEKLEDVKNKITGQEPAASRPGTPGLRERARNIGTRNSDQ